jgi:hypothetical protein
MKEISNLPEELQSFLAASKRTLRCDDGDWQIDIKPAEESHLRQVLPQGSVIIANNGCGDYLYLKIKSNGEISPQVNVFWHEEQRSELFSEHVKNLTQPPPSIPSKCSAVLYHDSSTPVEIGDEVSARDLIIFRREGRVYYVPGISKKNRSMEFNGLCWVGIRFHKGTTTGVLVDPKTFRLGRSVRFLKRSAEKIEELKPDEDLE